MECQSLASDNRLVSLVIADGLGSEIKDDISIFDVGKQKNRFRRIFKTTNDVYKKAGGARDSVPRGSRMHMHTT